jgi:glycosyltransferase involved in cell wall biosynthesis
MRILFINQYDNRGGAAVVARRLKHVLSAHEHISCRSLVAYKSGSDSSVFPIRSKAEELAERLIDRLFNKAGFQYQFFPFSSSFILHNVKEFRPDVISLHNSHGGYFQTSLLEKISALAPVVWTLHDMWSFTGNSAHTFGDESWKQLKNASHLTSIYPGIGVNRGASLLKQKAKIYRRSNLTVVTPSAWLHNLASQSPVFSKNQVLHIDNGVDLSVFHPDNDQSVRTHLNIPHDASVVMFSAESVKGNPWKGGNDLADVVKVINEKCTGQVHLIITGSNAEDWLSGFSNLVVHRIGYVSDEQEMARYLSASDVFLYPTRADNLPNVLIESIACGTPCVTFDIGGCSEIIQHNTNGIVVKPGDISGMADQLLLLLSDRERLRRYSAEARRVASEKFSIERMGEKYLEVFGSLIKP